MSIDSTQFRGTTVALITPFDDQNNISEKCLRSLVDWHVEQGTDVILACGTTGESATLSHDEHHRVMDIIIEQAAGRVPVMAGAGSNATSEAMSLTKHATDIGADAILSVGPYYNKPTQEGLYRHFKAIAESTDKPIVLYNVPGRTGKNIEAETTLRLAEIPNIIGIKEASGDIGQVMEIIRNKPRDFLVLSGDDSIALPVVAAGGDGVVSVIANEAPKMLHDMVHAAFADNWDKARELHYKLLPLMSFNFVEANPIPVKTACSLMGLCSANVRLPLVPMQPENVESMKTLLQEIGLM